MPPLPRNKGEGSVFPALLHETKTGGPGHFIPFLRNFTSVSRLPQPLIACGFFIQEQRFAAPVLARVNVHAS